MNIKMTRRNFLSGAAAAAAAAGLVACNNGGSAPADGDAAPADEAGADVDIYAAPAADAYPIDPDAEGVEALWASEETRDGWTRITNPEGVTLGVKDTAKIIQVNGLAFKDLDGNGKLDFYEDWRQSKEDRAASLAGMLTDAECIQLMWHGGVTDNSEGAEDPEYGLIAKGSCAGVSRLASNEESYAADIQWINTVQEKCEARPYGIPYINSTDPYQLFDIPNTIGLASAMDKDLWRKAGMWISRAWRATGVRLELGPQLDLYTTPTPKRVDGAVTEDPALDRDFIQAFGGGMQSTWGDDDATDDQGWGEESVAVMLKHFAGAGPIETGADDHYDQGKWGVFPNGNYHAHLLPFLDGGLNLDSSTGSMAAVMTNYGISYSPDKEYGDYVGGGYNKKQIGILRNAGWDGMITSDWGILDRGARGVEALSRSERYEKMVWAGVDQYGGNHEPDTTGAEGFEILKGELGDDGASERVHEAARHVLAVMMNIDLFDQPYAERAVAKAVFENEAAIAFGIEASEKAVVMLKNNGVIAEGALADKPKVYIPQRFTPSSRSFMGAVPASIDPSFDTNVAGAYFDIVTDGIGDPTGDPVEEGGENTYQASDIIRATAEELADVKYAIIGVKNPQDAFGGFTGGKDFGGNDTGVPVVFKPVSLQYRPYTADSDAVKKETIAGPDENGAYENRSHFGESSYATNESDLDIVIETKEKLPEGAKLILVVTADHPMCFHEIEPYCDAILFHFGPISSEAVAHILTGAVEPSGLLQFQMPKDMDEVEKQAEDTPRDMDPYVDAAGNAYDFCFGLNWSGVIDDERTATYKAAPLTECETPVIPGEN